MRLQFGSEAHPSRGLVANSQHLIVTPLPVIVGFAQAHKDEARTHWGEGTLGVKASLLRYITLNSCGPPPLHYNNVLKQTQNVTHFSDTAKHVLAGFAQVRKAEARVHH